MRELIGCSRDSAFKDHSHKDYIRELETELQNYRKQEQSLLRIIESLSARPQNSKEMSQGCSSEEEDERDQM
jgi:hypothetical protein